MIHSHYIKRRFLKPAYLFFGGLLLLFLAIGACFFVAPTGWLVESLVFLVFGTGVVLLGMSKTNYVKPGLTVAIWILVILALRRFELLSWISFAATLMLVGIATLLH